MSSCKDKKCPNDKVCNPASGRCVLKTGRIGKTLMTKRKSPSLRNKPPSPPNRYKHPEPETVKFSPETVGGLLSFNVFHSEKYNKTVYILGEVHHIEYTCGKGKSNKILADNFFFDLIESASKDRFLDVYLEVGYRPLQKRLRDRFGILQEKDEFDQGYLSRTLKKLNTQGCGADVLQRTKKCPYDNIRFHSADIRQELDEPVIDYLQTILDYVSYCALSDEESLKNCIRDYNIIMSYDKYKDIDILKKDINQALHNTKIIRQFNAIPEAYSEVKDYLWKTYQAALRKHVKMLTFDVISSKVKDLVNKYGYKIPLNKINTVQKRVNQIEKSTDFIAILMDLYLAGRIFRNFRDVNGRYSGSPKNIIIYAGDYHSTNYCKMFKKLGFKHIFKADKKGKNCLDVSGLNKVTWI